MDPRLLGALFILFAAFFVGSGVAEYRETKATLEEERIAHALALAGAEAEHAARIVELSASTTELEETLLDTEIKLLRLEEENVMLSERLGIVSNEKETLEASVTAIGEKIGLLEKLSATDKELLQKYSKVYFLNENYAPSALATVTPEFVYDKSRTLYVHAGVKPALERMMADAASTSPLLLISAYRSFADQSRLKSAYTVTYGSGANAFSADQGYSEHQLGSTVDFTTPELGSAFTKFDTTEGYQWLTENAWKYGFILSYPKRNGYYIYEPWHWRYVGVVLSVRLHQEGRYFYDLDQREIDRYLIDVF